MSPRLSQEARRLLPLAIVDLDRHLTLAGPLCSPSGQWKQAGCDLGSSATSASLFSVMQS